VAKAVRVVVHGRVQGVWFRESTRQQADRRGVTGWVANRSDGTVEMVLEGAPEAVDAVVDWARRGPRHAQVDDVEVATLEPEGHQRFRVR
jgi:acylphosphatase